MLPSVAPRFVVTANGDGVANHAGSATLTELADVLGLTLAYSNAMMPTRTRRSAHDPGRVLRGGWSSAWRFRPAGGWAAVFSRVAIAAAVRLTAAADHVVP